jgi:flagellar protein FlaG
MDVKGASYNGISDLLKIKTQSTEIPNKEKTSSTIIEKGVAELKEQRHESKRVSELLEKQVDNLNDLMKTNQTSLKFSVHEELGREFIQVIDKDTEEVIKEIPSEEFLDMVASMLKFAGLIVDEKI